VAAAARLDSAPGAHADLDRMAAACTTPFTANARPAPGMAPNSRSAGARATERRPAAAMATAAPGTTQT
jgi:hypothetical protein